MNTTARRRRVNGRALTAALVANRLAEYNRWRRGQGKYGWNSDPSKNLPPPFSGTVLGELIDSAVELLKGITGNTKENK